jgi:hypothetical protein
VARLADGELVVSLQPEPFGPVPEQTARVAHAAFPTGNTYLRLHDAIGSIYEDGACGSVFLTRGQPAEAPWRSLWLPCSSSQRVCQIVKQPIQCVGGSTGSICSVWSWLIQGSTTRCSASSARV